MKNNEKNKRKKEGKNWKKNYQVGIVFIGTSARELVSQWRKRSMTVSVEGWPKTKALLPGEKMMTAASAPHKAQSSPAFLKSPIQRLEKVLQGPFLLDFFYFYLMSSNVVCFFTIFVFSIIEVYFDNEYF